MHVKNRFIGESERVVSDILVIWNTPTLAVDTVDIEKAFDSVFNCLLFQILQKFGFGIDFVSLIKAIFKNKKSSIINGRKTTKHFKLERHAQQGDPFSAYLFILLLEIFFILYLLKITLRSKVSRYLDMNFCILFMQMKLNPFSKIESL